VQRAKSAGVVGQWGLVSVERIASAALVVIMLAVGMAFSAAGLILLVPVVVVGVLHGWWASRRLSPIPQGRPGAGEVAAVGGPGRVTVQRPTQAL
jgi:hypothetical protein